MDADGPPDRSVPPATGERLGWADAPAWLRAEVEGRLGGPVVEVVTQPTGFSPGLAARLRLADGRRAFVKAVGPEPNPDSPGFHRTEAGVMAALPRSAPVPRLLWSLDRRGWVALAFEDVDGAHPSLPWRPGELRRVLEMLTDMARALTPAPPGMPRIGDRLLEGFKGWRRLAAAHAAGTDDLASLDPWAVRHLHRLADLEAGWPQATEGPTLLHSDLRADNLLLTPTRVVAVDWPWACVGAAWVDLLLLLPSASMQGGPDPEATFAAHPVAAGVDPRAVTTALAAWAGFLVEGSRQPPPPGPAHPPGLPARPGPGRPRLAAPPDRLELRPSGIGGGAGPTSPAGVPAPRRLPQARGAHRTTRSSRTAHVPAAVRDQRRRTGRPMAIRGESGS